MWVFVKYCNLAVMVGLINVVCYVSQGDENIARAFEWDTFPLISLGPSLRRPLPPVLLSSRENRYSSILVPPLSLSLSLSRPSVWPSKTVRRPSAVVRNAS